MTRSITCFQAIFVPLASLKVPSGIHTHIYISFPDEHAKFFSDLKSLVEATYAANGRRAVVLICHSMGSPMALYFLNRQTRAWKDRHVLAMITMAGAWGGTVRALKVFAVGRFPMYFGLSFCLIVIPTIFSLCRRSVSHIFFCLFFFFFFCLFVIRHALFSLRRRSVFPIHLFCLFCLFVIVIPLLFSIY